MDLGVGDDAATAVDFLAAGFELGFHEKHHRRPRLAQRDEHGDHQPQRDERHVTDHEVDGSADLFDGHVPYVVPFEVRDPWIGPKALVELPVPDIERHDVTGTALQETVGEPSGRCADVECP